MTGLMIAGVIALVAMYVLLVLGGYRSRLVSDGSGSSDGNLKQRGRWYNVRKDIKQSVITDTHGDLVHQDGSTTGTEVARNHVTDPQLRGPNDVVL